MHDIEVMANEPTVVHLVNLIISTGPPGAGERYPFVPFEQTLQLRLPGWTVFCRKSRRRPNSFTPLWSPASRLWPT